MSDRELLDDDGENKAVRAFLLLYGGTEAGSFGQMRRHLERSGFENCWPEWVSDAPYNQHLTKGGAQSWIRHLFAMEAATAAPHQSAVKPWQDRMREYYAQGTVQIRGSEYFKDTEIADWRASRQSAEVPGWKLVPVEPTEEMISDGFESCPDEIFSTQHVWDEYEALSGCQQAAYRARACYKAMIASAPTLADQQGEKMP